MKKILLASVAAIGMSGTALAADLPAQMPVRAPAVVAPLFSWTGFYIGGHVGGGWADKDWTQTFSSFGLALDRNVTRATADGFLGGAQAGFNWQVNQWLFGVEGDWSWTDAKGCSGHVVFPAYAGCADVNWYATLAGRAGVAWDRALFYAKGGVAFVDDDYFITFNGVQTTNTTNTIRAGWMVGAGLEYAFAPNWSAKVEYDFLDFHDGGNPFTYTANPVGLVENWDIDQQVHVVKAGINFRFGTP